MSSTFVLKYFLLLVAIHSAQSALIWPLCKLVGRICMTHMSCCSDHCGCNNRCAPRWASTLPLPVCPRGSGLFSILDSDPQPPAPHVQIPPAFPQPPPPVAANPPVVAWDGTGNCKSDGVGCVTPAECCNGNCEFVFDHGIRRVLGHCNQQGQSISITIEELSDGEDPGDI